MTRKEILAIVGITACSIGWTFTIPAMLWLMKTLVVRSEYGGLFNSISIILCTSLWFMKTKAFCFHTTSSQWRVFYYLGLIVTLGLLLFNIQSQPVSKITGQARSPFEVLDVIALVPLAEELVFRGVIWSMIEKIAKGDHVRLAALVGTSLLFGIEHLGYWAQSNWPLPPDAYFHAISMVFAGLFFGFFRLKSNSLAIPAVLHMLANGAILLTQ
jgi:membrane protease YdiL (CAAX protease family)